MEKKITEGVGIVVINFLTVVILKIPAKHKKEIVE